MAGPVEVILMMYVCVGMAKRDASPLIYRGFPTGAFTLKKTKFALQVQVKVQVRSRTTNHYLL
jgi:hypothetical protein